MIDTEALRKKVIDLAIQGKLTYQLPSDGDAETLYAQILDQKSQLIKEGKLKKDKALPDIAADEVPFEIPNNWKWVRFGTIITLQSGQDLNANDYNSENNGIPYITGASNYRDDGSLIINRWTDSPKAFAQKGDILLSCKGTVGKLTILDEAEVHIARQIMGIRTYSVSILFIRYFVDCMIERIKNASKGLIPGIERNDILSLCCPLPPITEQKRIVERIENVLTEIDVIDNLQAKYSNDLAVLKSKIIDAGIRGKLTEQLPEDGEAEDLYAQIKNQKLQLIKEGKIKKEKPLPDIAADEIPFEIPKNWKWVRFGELYSLTNGIASRGTPGGKAHPVLRLADLIEGEISTENVRDIELSDSEFNSHKICNGDIVFIRVNGSRDKVANAFLYHGDDEISYCDHLFSGRKISEEVDSIFIMHLFRSTMVKQQVDTEIKTTAGQNTINQGSMAKVLIPLPPAPEQKRIVKKFEDVLQIIGT